LSPDPSFFFGSKGHNRALAYLRYGLTQKEGFIVVTGSPGTGKTTLARALLQEVGRSKVIVAELNTTHLEAEDVLRMVAASFGLEFEDAPKATLLKRMETYFISRYRAGYHILLIIDEAQNLPFESIEELRMLSNFYLGKHALIQIFLLGQEQFRDSLYSKDLEQLRQRVVASCHLEPLNREETRQYIEHRLQLVGWQQDPQISDRGFARINSLTKGVPRRINTFCDRLFLFGSLDDLHHLKDEHIKLVAKELMYEVSAKNVNLSDIKPGEELEKRDTSVDVEKIDSELLGDFSDDLPDKPIIKKIDATSKADVDPIEKTQSNSHNSDSQRIVVTNDNTAVESVEPVPMYDSEPPQMDTKSDWWKLVALAVDYYVNPNNYPEMSNSREPLAEGITEMLKVAVGKKNIPSHMRIDELSGIEDETIHQACTNYIKNIFLTSKANYYKRMGVRPEASLEDIRIHYRYLFRLLQTEQGDATEQDETYIRRINQAFSALRSPEKRKEYDEFLAEIENNKQITEAADGALSSDSEGYESRSQRLGVAGDISESSLKPERRNNSTKFWLILIICLFCAGGAAFYYLQPNLKELKADFGLTFKELESLEEIDVMPSNLAESASTDDSETKVAPVLLEPVELQSAVTKSFNENIKKTDSQPIKEVKEESDKTVVIVEKTSKTQTSSIEKEPVKKKEVKSEPVKNTVIVKPQAKVTKPEVVKKAAEPVPVKPAIVQKPIKSTPSKVVPIPVVKPVEVAAVSKPKPVEKIQIGDKELSRLISDFSLIYEEGQLDSFMSLFSKDALTNNDEDWDSIRKDYKSLFDTTEMRVIELKNMRWNKEDIAATGRGEFIVTVLRRGGDNVRKFTGNIKLVVEKANDKLLINGMYHSYGDDDN